MANNKILVFDPKKEEEFFEQIKKWNPAWDLLPKTLEEYEKTIEVLEGMRKKLDNDPLFHYWTGYAYYQAAMKTQAGEKEQKYITSARENFTRAQILDTKGVIPKDCAKYQNEAVNLYMESDEFQECADECGDVEVYTEEEMKTVEDHIQKYFGKFEQVFHELVSEYIHVDICIVPPYKDRDYYMLFTMGMGVHRMNVPDSFGEEKGKFERAELAIALPKNWKVGDSAEKWYWPIRLLKSLARLPIESDSWLGWGHSIDHEEPFADNTKLCASVLIDVQGSEMGGQDLVLPNGEQVNFYQVIPIYREELNYKLNHDTEALLEIMGNISLVVDPKRPNCTQTEEFLHIDDAKWHIQTIKDKDLPVDELTAYNHMAIYLRWFIKRNLMSKEFLIKYQDIVQKVKNEPQSIDLREFIRDELQGKLLYALFNNAGEEFSRKYYNQLSELNYPDFPSDIDDYALEYFGKDRYYSDEFKDEAYLFVPFDESYYKAMAKTMSLRYTAWRANRNDDVDEIPSELANAFAKYFGYDCEYFPPMSDNEPLKAAYSYSMREGVREGYFPVLLAVDEALWQCLIMNSDKEHENAENYYFDEKKVKAYRKKMLSKKLKGGTVYLHEFLNMRKAEAKDDDMDWDSEILGEVEDGEANNMFTACWDANSPLTIPMLLVRIPVKNPWEIFAYVPFGGWNECPETEQLMSIAKYWYEKHGAVPAIITHDELEMVVPKPVSKKQAMLLAQEQYAFCPDSVDGEDTTVGNLADSLRKSKIWYFWWD